MAMETSEALEGHTRRDVADVEYAVARDPVALKRRQHDDVYHDS